MIENNCLNLQKKRFEYIDAMRGFAIFFIVFGHLPLVYGTHSSLIDFPAFIKLPVFFFISGFVFNSERMISGGLKTCVSKFRQLIIPAVFFCAIYLLVNKIDIYTCVTHRFKCGYWFTFKLFEFIIIQYLWELFATRLKINKSKIVYLVGPICTALIFYVLSTQAVTERLGIVSGVVGTRLLRYYLFFVIGRLIRLHLDDLLQYKYKNVFVSVIVVGFMLMAIFDYGLNINISGLMFHIKTVIFELLALLSIFVLFYTKRTYFSSSSRASKAITFIGRRTLDIYLLHYFFLPKDLSVFGHYFVNHPAPILELAFCGIVTILVVVVCLIVSEILRQSTFCRKWLLGAK